MSGPVTSVARVEDVQIFLKDPVYYTNLLVHNGMASVKKKKKNKKKNVGHKDIKVYRQ